MSSGYVIVLEGLDALSDLASITPKLTEAARQAINRTLDRTRTQAAREIRRQVNFPASYLSPSGERLSVSQRATDTRLEGTITGRWRPTSLARFAKNTDPKAARRRGGVTVAVKPGSAKFLKGAWLVRLRAGKEKTDTQFNLGLAMRLKPGESLRNSRGAVRLDNNVWLLYGPSVSQVFSTVRDDLTPETMAFLEQEFERLRALRNI